MLRLAGFVSKSLSLDRAKAGAQGRELPCGSPHAVSLPHLLPALVLVAPAGGSPISSQSRRWLGLAPVLLLFLLQLNSLNQSQGSKPLKGPGAIGGLDQGFGLSPMREPWLRVLALLCNTKPCTCKGSGHLQKYQRPSKNCSWKSNVGNYRQLSVAHTAKGSV